MAQKTDKLIMRVDPDFVERIDDWRRTQPDLPNRSEAVRRLVEQSLVPDDSSSRHAKLARAFEIYEAATKHRESTIAMLREIRDPERVQKLVDALAKSTTDLIEAEKTIDELAPPARKRRSKFDDTPLPENSRKTSKTES